LARPSDKLVHCCHSSQTCGGSNCTECLGRGEVYFVELNDFYMVCIDLRTNSDGMYALTELAVVIETRMCVLHGMN